MALDLLLDVLIQAQERLAVRLVRDLQFEHVLEVVQDCVQLYHAYCYYGAGVMYWVMGDGRMEFGYLFSRYKLGFLNDAC